MKLANFFEDMTVFRDKTAGARSVFTPYGSLSAALENLKSDRVISLNGEWSFGYYTSLLKVPEKIVSPAADVSPLSKISLPATVKAQDIGIEFKNGFDMPFDPPYVAPDTPAAVYIKDTEIDETTDGYRKYIVFEGVSSCIYLFVNGEYAGFAEVSSAMQEFDITDLLKIGKNRIAAVVLKYCDGSYIETDREPLFGIYGDTYILLRPKGHIRDFIVSTALSEDCTKGFVNVTVDAVVYSSMTARLYSPEGELISDETPDSDGHISFTVDNPRFYSAENPILYTLILGFGGEYIPVKTGIRELVWDKTGLLYNKKRITLKPVLYGKSVKNDGRIMTEKDYISDLSNLKKHSVNTIVTLDRPMPPLFYRLCDEKGFYVINTADLKADRFEKHFPDVLSSSNEWEGAVYNRANLLTARDKNFSCVLAWNLDSSVKTGKNIFFTAERIRKLDKMRTVHYSNEGRGGFPLGLIDFDSLYVFDGTFESKEISQRVKRLYKPVTVSPLDLEGGRFEIQNNLDFSYISGIEIFCELSAFGKATDTKSLGIMTLASKKSAEFCLDVSLPVDGDAALRFYYKNIFATDLLPDNYTLGFDCFELKRPYRRTEKLLPENPLTLKEYDDRFEVKGRDFSLTFDRALGYITDIFKKDTLVCEKLVPGVFLCGENAGIGHDQRIVCRDAAAELNGMTGNVHITAFCIIGEAGVPHHMQFSFEYIINRAGEVTVKYLFERDNDIAGISRIGFDAYMPTVFNTAEYYSLGPVSLKGDILDGYFGRFKEQIRFRPLVTHHMRARFVSVYDSSRCGLIFYKKQSEFSFFVNTRSQQDIAKGVEGFETVLSANEKISEDILTDTQYKGEISFRPINADDGSLWGNATAVYKSGKEEK